MNDQGPPDLDEVLKKLQQSLGGLFVNRVVLVVGQILETALD